LILAYTNREFNMAKYFKKPNGLVIEATPNHDIDSLMARFEECDANGKPIKVEKKAVKKPSKKKEK
tara:strand:+ start:2836 stop:3033 length:198 start_codon:yes stop_codon:yes gene_type:complete